MHLFSPFTHCGQTDHPFKPIFLPLQFWLPICLSAPNFCWPAGFQYAKRSNLCDSSADRSEQNEFINTISFDSDRHWPLGSGSRSRLHWEHRNRTTRQKSCTIFHQRFWKSQNVTNSETNERTKGNRFSKLIHWNSSFCWQIDSSSRPSGNIFTRLDLFVSSRLRMSAYPTCLRWSK